MAGKSIQTMTDAELEQYLADQESVAAGKAPPPSAEPDGVSLSFTPAASEQQAAPPPTMRDPMAEAAVSAAGATLTQGLAAASAMAAPIVNAAAPAGDMIRAADQSALRKAIYPQGAAEGVNDKLEQLPDWMWMPEFRDMSMATVKALAGSMAAGGKEAAAIVKKQFPDMKVEPDGRYVTFTSRDGEQYSLKPGFRPSDVVRGGAAALAAAPIAYAAAPGILGGAAAGAATAVFNEVLQAATGGTFDGDQIKPAALVGGAIPLVGKALSATGELARTGLEKLGAMAPRAAAPAAAAQTFDDAANAIAQASRGEAAGAAKVAASVAPDRKLIADAADIGASGFLTPEVVSGNQSFREAAKSMKAGEAALRELGDENTRGFIAQARGLLEDYGATMQRGVSDVSLRDRLGNGLKMLSEKRKAAFKPINEGLAEVDALATQTREFLQGRAREARGLPEAEQALLTKLENPSFKGLEVLREGVKAAKKNSGEYAGLDKGIADILDGKLAADQLLTAERYGVKTEMLAARELAKQEATLRGGINALFGKQLKQAIDGSMVNKMGAAVKGAIAGDTSKLLSIYDKIPPSMRAEVVMNTFGQVLEQASDLKSFVGLFDAVEANPQLRGVVMTSMLPKAATGLTKVVNVARGFVRADAAAAYPARMRAAAALPGGQSGAFSSLVDAATGQLPGSARGLVKLATNQVAGKEADGLRLAAEWLTKEAPFLVRGATSAGDLRKYTNTSLFKRLTTELGVSPAERVGWLESALQRSANFRAADAAVNPPIEEQQQ